jgi:uncharacterized repeat protein (TIGR03803 family)
LEGPTGAERIAAGDDIAICLVLGGWSTRSGHETGRNGRSAVELPRINQFDNFLRTVINEIICGTPKVELSGGSMKTGKALGRPVACVAAVLVALAAAAAAPAQSFNVLVNFNGANGASPRAGMAQGLDGNFYGTTRLGGANNSGSVFRMSPSGKIVTLYSFCTQSNCGDGANPFGGLVLGTDGNFYGTTLNGGEYNYGAVFKITPNGMLTVLHSFTYTDGASPYGALTQGTDGYFYGTTFFGGHGDWGVVFKVTRTGSYTELCDFYNYPQYGDYPYGALVQGTDGNFYGTNYQGGSVNDGTVFKMTPAGKLTALHSFSGSDGSAPYGGLVQAADGGFYGTTAAGGASGYGTVFRVSASGQTTTLYSFCAQPNCADGAMPRAGLIQATDGKLYGTTQAGGADNDGTLFEITTHGVLTTLYSFDGSGGSNPWGGLTQSTNGGFYGTAYQGGSGSSCQHGCGTAFALSMGLKSFVETLPGSGKAGAVIKILGNNLSSASKVTFNGVPATFSVVSATQISATVPAGATTGSVRVTLANGVLSSNVAFRVR